VKRCFHQFLSEEINLSEKHNEEVKLELHKEELEILKNRIETAEVKVYKKTFTEEKQISVPVTREELIIEKKSLNQEEVETIRIPLVEEQIEIIKHPVILEEVDISRHQFEEIIHVDETLKKEILRVDKTGDITIREE
jgi:uncharacterized protein (TIGR02271 family)